jgi:hypothetical protein
VTTLLDAPPDGALGRGSAHVEFFDADKLRHAIDRGKVRRFVRGDGTVEDCIRALDFGQCTKQDIIDGFRPTLWVPRDELVAAGYLPDGEEDFGTNLWTTAGWARILANLTAVPGAAAVYDATHTRLGVGNGVTAAAIGNTDLAAAAGSANRQFKLVDGAPTVAASGGTGSVAWTATFATGVGNFVWAEWCVDNGTADGTTVSAPMLNRAVPNSLITKTSAAAVALTVTLAGT